MGGWLARRLAAAVLLVVAIATLTFILMHLAPGNPFLPGPDTPVDPATVARLETQYGLDRPLPVQYVRYLAALAHGELGESFSEHRPVAEALAAAVPNTLLLAGAALVLDFGLGLVIGIVQAAYARRRLDTALGAVTLFFYSLPTFWLALVLLLVFGEWLRWFPVGGATDVALHSSLSWIGRLGDRLWHLALPAATLGLVGAAGTARYQRAALLEALHADYVRTARAKGLPARAVLLRHALRNALFPVITLAGLAFPFLLTGAVLVETVFGWPGMGKLTVDAILARDYPLVTACAIVAGAMVVLGNLLADVAYAVADPQVRLAGAHGGPAR